MWGSLKNFAGKPYAETARTDWWGGSDGLPSRSTLLDKSIANQFNTAHQKCTVHLFWNLMKHVRITDRKLLAAGFRKLLNVDDNAYSIDDALHLI